MKEFMYSAQIVLECLCYALHQAYYSQIGVTRFIEDDEDELTQLKELVQEISFSIEEWGIDEVMLEDIKWYDPSLMGNIIEAKTLADIAGR